MVRFILACIFYTTVARWGYSEVYLLFPEFVPYINQAMEKVQIPTHNQWSKGALYDYVDRFGEFVEEAHAAVVDIREEFRDRD